MMVKGGFDKKNLKELLRRNGKVLLLAVCTLVVLVLIYEGYIKEKAEGYEFLKSAFWMIGIVILVGLCLLYYFAGIRRAPVHRVYLIAGILFGILYCALIPPYTVPDEQTHYDECYDVSNFLLGDGKASPGMIYKRAGDLATPFWAYPSLDTYQAVYSNLISSCNDTSMVETYRSGGDVSSIGYVIPGIGITLGRILHLGVVPTYWLARWFNYLVFMLLIYLAMKKAPIGKNLILVFALLPMVMQEAMSVAYDCLTNGVAVWLLAHALAMALQKEQVNWKQLVPYGILAVILAGIKGGVYLPVCGLALLIPVKRFGNWKRYLASAGAVLAVVIAGFLITNIQYIQGVLGTEQSQTVNEETQEGQVADIAEEDTDQAADASQEEQESDVFITGYEVHYSVSDLIHSPLTYVRILLSTLKSTGDFYFQSMIGNFLGWLTITIPSWIICGFFCLLLLSTIENNVISLSVLQKLWLLIVTGAVGVLVLTIMLLGWTPVGYPVVLGVQGRYFLPVMLLPFLIFKSKFLEAKKDIYPAILAGTVVLEFLTCFCICDYILG